MTKASVTTFAPREELPGRRDRCAVRSAARHVDHIFAPERFDDSWPVTRASEIENRGVVTQTLERE